MYSYNCCNTTLLMLLVHAKALWGEPARMHTCTCTQLRSSACWGPKLMRSWEWVNVEGLGSMGGMVVVLLREHGMLWNTGGKMFW